LSTIVTPPLNTATTLFNKYRDSRRSNPMWGNPMPLPSVFVRCSFTQTLSQCVLHSVGWRYSLQLSMQAVSMNGSHRGKSVYVEVPEIGFLLNLYNLTFGQKNTQL